MADNQCACGPGEASGGASGGANGRDGSEDPVLGTADNGLEFEFTVSVPFPGPLEAQIAHRFLLSNFNQLGPAHRVIQLDGSILTVHLSSIEPEDLRVSISACMELLSMVLRAFQIYLPLPMTSPLTGTQR